MKKARFAVEQAEAKSTIFLEYEYPKRIKELESDVKKAKSAELASRAALDLEQSKVERLLQAIKERNSPTPGRDALTELEHQALAAFDRAISLEEQFRTKLDQFAKTGQSNDELRPETQELSDQLRHVIDRAELGGPQVSSIVQ